MTTKYQQAVSHSTTTTTTTTLDTFPNEIIILILTKCAIIDLKTLKILMSVSSRMRRISIHVLTCIRLPAIQLSLVIDQEGKSRATSKFEFTHFCPLFQNVLFTSQQPITRRYYTHKAYPVVRSMAIGDNRPDIKFSSISSSLSSSVTLASSHSSSTIDRQSTNTATSTASYNSTDVYYLGSPKKLSAQKEGFHILQVPSCSSNRGPSWKLAYRITDKYRSEYLLTPITITIGYKYLLKLDALNSSNCKKMSGAKTVNRMKNWWFNRLF